MSYRDKKSTRDGIAPGIAFEYRVSRIRFCQGTFTRRSIDVWPSDPRGDKLAELDCISTHFDPHLRRLVEVIECKTTGGGSGEIDRLLWLRGARSLINADTVTFAKSTISPRTRETARRLQVDLLDTAVMSVIERDLGIAADWWPGFHDPDFGENVIKPARMELNRSESLNRAGKYLFGLFWFTDDFSRIKQLRTLFGLLQANRGSLQHDALALATGEATTLFLFTMLSIAFWRNQQTPADFESVVRSELATGVGEQRSLRLLLQRIDVLHKAELEAVHAAYVSTGLGRQVVPSENLESAILRPPEWVNAFIDLCTRFFKRPHLATDLLRWSDLWAAGLLGKQLPDRDRTRLFPTQIQESLNNGLELVLAFLQRQWDVPADLFKPIPRGKGLSVVDNIPTQPRFADNSLAEGSS